MALNIVVTGDAGGVAFKGRVIAATTEEGTPVLLVADDSTRKIVVAKPSDVDKWSDPKPGDELLRGRGI